MPCVIQMILCAEKELRSRQCNTLSAFQTAVWKHLVNMRAKSAALRFWTKYSKSSRVAIIHLVEVTYLHFCLICQRRIKCPRSKAPTAAVIYIFVCIYITEPMAAGQYAAGKEGILTRKQLEQYKSKKAEIEELNDYIWQLGSSESLMGSSTVFDYRSGYPKPQAVVGVDRAEYWKKKERYEKKIEQLKADCEEAERFVE